MILQYVLMFIVGYKSSWELMLFVVMYNMPTLNKIYLLTYFYLQK